MRREQSCSWSQSRIESVMSFASRLILSPAALLASCLLFSALLSASGDPVYASAPADRAVAQALFHEKGCEHCHGVDGVGGEKGPSLSGVGRKLKPDQIHKQILDGGEGMPPFADVLAPDEVQRLVSYLSTKKKKPGKAGADSAANPAPAPKPDTGGSDDQ